MSYQNSDFVVGFIIHLSHKNQICLLNFLFIKLELEQSRDKPLFYAVLGVFMPVFKSDKPDFLL